MSKQRHKKQRTYTLRADADPAQPDAVRVIETVQQDGRPPLTRVLIRRLNVARPICDFMLGEDHPPQHRFAAGIVMMFVGVSVAKGFGHVSNVLIAHLGDLLGYSIHGLGLMPFLEHINSKVKQHEAEHHAEKQKQPVKALRSEVQRE